MTWRNTAMSWRNDKVLQKMGGRNTPMTWRNAAMSWRNDKVLQKLAWRNITPFGVLKI